MNQNATELTEESFFQLIDNFRNDFEDILKSSEGFDVDLKLFILQCHICNYSITEIKNELIELNSDSPTPSIDSYLKKDCNKISRIFKVSTPNDLIYCIKIITLCKIIIHKYPYPMLAGFPFDGEWTPKYLRKYICLYFGVKRRTININSLENYFKTKDGINKAFLNEDICKNMNLKIFYYLYIRFGKLSSGEMTTSHKYNRYIYATLIEFCESFIGSHNGKNVFRLYRKNNNHINRKHKTTLNLTLYDILNQLLKYNEPTNPTIICMDFNSIKNFKFRSYNSLKVLPPFIFLSLDKLTQHYTIMSKPLNEIGKIKEMQADFNHITLDKVSDKRIYLSEMSKKIQEYCGDY